MQFIERLTEELIKDYPRGMSRVAVVLPGKRPLFFLKKKMRERRYQGILPRFLTIDELVQEMCPWSRVEGIPLWLEAYSIYKKEIDPNESLKKFIGWFPTLLKDWDDMKKFAYRDSHEREDLSMEFRERPILEWLLGEERIRNWGMELGEEVPEMLGRNLDFWQRMTVYLPALHRALEAKAWATQGMQYEYGLRHLEAWADSVEEHFIFCGFNALTLLERHTLRALLKRKKADAYYHSDTYYLNDRNQEAGKFLRESRESGLWNQVEEAEFPWVFDTLSDEKKIHLYEVSGDVSQVQKLPDILESLPLEYLQNGEKDYSSTAVVLMDEGLLPACLEVLDDVSSLNITMGVPMKSLAYSQAIRGLMHLQAQMHATGGAPWAYPPVQLISVLNHLSLENDEKLSVHRLQEIYFKEQILLFPQQRVKEILTHSLWRLICPYESAAKFLEVLVLYGQSRLGSQTPDLEYENIAQVTHSLISLMNCLERYPEVDFSSLEVMYRHLVDQHTIDLEGDPLQGLQMMGLLETRLLNFDHLILLSCNEGKLPVGQSQTTMIPYECRKQYHLNTFLDNDGIYAYHFYRLIQKAETVHMLYNSLNGGLSTGEKSRFITQLQVESGLQIVHHILHQNSRPVKLGILEIPKTPVVIEALNEWKNRISASSLITYLKNPLDFYNKIILKIEDPAEVVAEMGNQVQGTVVHKVLELLYKKHLNIPLQSHHLDKIKKIAPSTVENVLREMVSHPEVLETGMNVMLKEAITAFVTHILECDKNRVEAGDRLEILALEQPFDFKWKDFAFRGVIDRIERLNGKIQVIDYKKNIPSKSDLKPKEELKYENRYLLQLWIYQTFIQHKYNELPACGIWGYQQGMFGPTLASLDEEQIQKIGMQVENLITEILNPDIAFCQEQILTIEEEQMTE